MYRQIRQALLFILAIFLLSACSPSLKEEQKEIKKSVVEAMKKNPSEPNNKNKDIEFKLPFGFEVDNETPNNIILKNGSKKYILFYNPHEDQTSKVVYESTLQQSKKYEVNETYKTDNKFGYLLIKKLSKTDNELIVGIGGVKITTQAKTASLVSEAATMTDIVNSVKMK